jgi:transcriptional regulator with PAS, ATPase and Fis domain
LGEWIGLVTMINSTTEAAAAFEQHETGLLSGPVLRPVLHAAKSVSATPLTVILEGETGTGKEMLARAMHAWSGRRGPYLAVNCGALPESLVEAELFGHARGAYTGADRARPGMFRAADGGTLVLDEIADLPMPMQTKLLRVLQEHEVLPVGEAIPVKIDVRVMATAQGPLLSNVQSGRFRADLFGRLDEVTIQIPPLRARIEEVPFLFQQLLARHGGGVHRQLEPALIEQLCLYDWPFNVREMDALARRLLALHASAPNLLRAHLPPRMLATNRGQQAVNALAVAAPHTIAPEAAAPPKDDEGARDERDLAALIKGLRTHKGKLARAAADAGISRQRAYRLMGTHPDLDLKEFRSGASKGRGSG